MKQAREDLRLRLATLPASAGVYIFKNDRDRIIYIGKAKNLRNRVRTYFQSPDRLDPKTRRMISQVTAFETMVTSNEIESLILEANLVHEHKPRYNVRLKDDKHFPYIKVTTNEPFPRVLVVRRIERDGATYFGPYTSSRSMRRTIGLVTGLFKIRSCSLQIPAPAGRKHKVCLDYHIKRCGGPCEGFQSEADYAELVSSVLLVLKGRSQELIDRLTAKMNRASDKMQFEDAAELRDQIQALLDMRVRQHVDVGEAVDQDIVSLARDDRDAVAVVMQIREGVLIGRQDFQLAAELGDTDQTILESFLTQYYHAQPNLPETVLLPIEPSDADLLEQWLKRLKGSRVRVMTPKIGGKIRLVELAARNARHLLDELLIQKRAHTERASRMVTSLQEELKLARVPRRMVCFDISNTGETDAVGSCVYFENGKPKKSEYRHFRIKGVRGQDDFKMMREVVGRYFYRIRDEAKQPPDLVVVDGGKGQLSSALAELSSLGFADQPVIGLAKRLEEVFRPNESEATTIPRSAPALLLLKRIRDEAHRFAITFNRKVRSRRTIKSALDDIPGVGPAKRQALLAAFGSVEQIRTRTIEEIVQVRGISEKLATEILKRLS
ncbi:MAG: excinuclease ABC subunit UvrC [candidate division Zixibacteria bacterium]|jgi:excinuclease ABC subunit C|nr:excinuclease ABC subunit UvrC [candidate division Zixibacteria bacterium]